MSGYSNSRKIEVDFPKECEVGKRERNTRFTQVNKPKLSKPLETMTCARYASDCAACQQRIFVGAEIVPTSSRNAALRESTWMLLLPKTVEQNIEGFAAAGGRLEDRFWIHKDCAQAAQETRSGRQSRKPQRFDERTFVKGSGAGGCDQYDGNFNGHASNASAGGHDCFRRKYQPRRETAEDRAFLVSDEELTSQHALMEQQSDAKPAPKPKEDGIGMLFARAATGTQRGQCMGYKCGKMLTAADKDQAMCNACWDATFSPPAKKGGGGGGGGAEEEEWLSGDETEDDSDWSVESDED